MLWNRTVWGARGMCWAVLSCVASAGGVCCGTEWGLLVCGYARGLMVVLRVNPRIAAGAAGFFDGFRVDTCV